MPLWATVAINLFMRGFRYLFGGKQQAAGVAQGRAEAERDGAASDAKVADAVAAAEANAPRSHAEALQRLKDHTA